MLKKIPHSPSLGVNEGIKKWRELSMNFYFKKVFAFLILVFCLHTNISANKLQGRVVRVLDGDTFVFLEKGEENPIRVRLYGIDAPEKGQPYSVASTEFLEKILTGVIVSINITDVDKYERLIGKVSTALYIDVNLEMLKAGMAWHYSFFDKSSMYIIAEKEAKERKKGLWKSAKPMNPYKYRQNKKK